MPKQNPIRYKSASKSRNFSDRLLEAGFRHFDCAEPTAIKPSKSKQFYLDLLGWAWTGIGRNLDCPGQKPYVFS
jgi:hypothetical protein